jgi:hypothetical protein
MLTTACAILVAGMMLPAPRAFDHRELISLVLPGQKELQYEEIPWRAALWPATEEANRLDRPILLWAMNGHPLACT